jgi:hypothetical protein
VEATLQVFQQKNITTNETGVQGQYKTWFLDYASYVILERAVPAVEDGLKPVQRRILHALNEMDDGRFNKVANIIGQTNDMAQRYKDMGMTDYLAFVQRFESASSQAMMGSWATDLEEGFSDSVISALMRIQNQLAVATRMAVLGKLADNMLSTYLGSDAGKRVLNGQIKRGDGETIRAALVMADMRDSTGLAEQHGRQVYIEMLNQFYDAIAVPEPRGASTILPCQAPSATIGSGSPACRTRTSTHA